MVAKVVCIASLVVLAGVVVSPRPAEAQVNLQGATRVEFSGIVGDLTNKPTGFMLAGLSHITEGGAELGGDLSMRFSPNMAGGYSVSGFGFFRGGYNFIGESLTVPFVMGAVGAPLDGTGDHYPYEAGGGIKRFLSEASSFDITVAYQGNLNSFSQSGTVTARFGISFYFGN